MDKVCFAYGAESAEPDWLFQEFSLKLGDHEGVTVFLGGAEPGNRHFWDCLAVLLVPNAGAIRYPGLNTYGQAPAVGFVFQDAGPVPWKTILANVLFGAEIIAASLADGVLQDARDFWRGTVSAAMKSGIRMSCLAACSSGVDHQGDRVGRADPAPG